MILYNRKGHESESEDNSINIEEATKEKEEPSDQEYEI